MQQRHKGHNLVFKRTDEDRRLLWRLISGARDSRHPYPIPQTTMPSPPMPPKRPVLTFLKRRYRGWRSRHQLPFNFVIHLFGIPMAVVGLLMLLTTPWHEVSWVWGLAGLGMGYLLQGIGHMAEGNDVGELIPLKKALGLPYIAVAPQYQPLPEAPPISNSH